MASDICALSARELIDAYGEKRLSPVEVMKAVLDQAEAVNPRINALFSIKPEQALTEASESEKRWHRGHPVGELDGLPIAVKDSVKAEGFPYWRGCGALMQTPPAQEDAPPSARLKEAGAIIFAKTTMPDFGMLASGVSSAHGIVRNAWNTDLNPGGSSAGAASSVAAGVTPCSIGTDSAGSVRVPAAHCGLFGFKPTNGRIPHLPPDLMRSAGPLARSVADGALLMTVLSRPDPRDFRALPPQAENYHLKLARDLKGLRLGLLLDMGFGIPTSAEVRQAVEKRAAVFEDAGAVVEAVPPVFDFDPHGAIERYFMIRTHLEYNALPAAQRPLVLPYIRQWCSKAEELSAVEAMQDQVTIEQAKTILLALFADYDYVVSPVMPVSGFAAEALGVDPDHPIAHLGFASLYNQTGQPAASICCGFAENGLPIGMQIIGRRFDDLGTLQLSHAYEQRRELDMLWPMEEPHSK